MNEHRRRPVPAQGRATSAPISLACEMSENAAVEKNASGTTQADHMNRGPTIYHPLTYMDRSGTQSYHLFNHLGTTLALASAAQALTDTYRWNAWGVQLASTGSTTNPFGYVGALGYYHEPDLGDLRIGARTSRPRLGRWLTADPLEYGESWYAYADNMCVLAVDPSGLYELAPSCQKHRIRIRTQLRWARTALAKMKGCLDKVSTSLHCDMDNALDPTTKGLTFHCGGIRLKVSEAWGDPCAHTYGKHEIRFGWRAINDETTAECDGIGCTALHELIHAVGGGQGVGHKGDAWKCIPKRNCKHSLGP
jgi:RHS repeat-associated protein